MRESRYHNMMVMGLSNCHNVPSGEILVNLTWDQLDQLLNLKESTDGLHYVLLYYLWELWQDGLIDIDIFRFELSADRLALQFGTVFVDMLVMEDYITHYDYIKISTLRFAWKLKRLLLTVTSMPPILYTIYIEFKQRGYYAHLYKIDAEDGVLRVFPANSESRDTGEMHEISLPEIIVPFFES